MAIIDSFLLLTSILLAIFVIVSSFIYSHKVKTKYRWVKLFWGIEITVYMLLLLWTFFGGTPTRTTQYLSMLLPLSCLACGMVVAFARLKEEQFIHYMQRKLNGEFEKWVEEQKNLITKK